MNTERNLGIASKSNAVPVARWWGTFCGLLHTACYTVFGGAFEPLILLDFFRARIFFNPLLYRLSYRARGGIVTGKTEHAAPVSRAANANARAGSGSFRRHGRGLGFRPFFFVPIVRAEGVGRSL